MSDAWENILENIDEHIEEYFEDEKKHDELLDFIFTNDQARKVLYEYIADSKLGQKIADKVYEGMQDKGDYLADLDRDS